jgi:Ca2+-binding RTX toxin-like protein
MPRTLVVQSHRPVTAEIVVRSSVAPNGSQVDGSSSGARLSADGRYLVFESAATNLVTGDDNGARDIFRKDLTTGEIVLVSAAADGGRTDTHSFNAEISADGRYVVFESSAENLVAGDGNGTTDIFRKDLTTGEILRVSLADDGSQAVVESRTAHISADGRYVVFESDAGNLVAGDTNNRTDIFRKDLATGEILRVSSVGDTQTNDGSYNGRISADGRYVVFESDADNLVAGDGNESSDIFRKDILTGEIVRITASSDGIQANNDSYNPRLSANGRYVVFSSDANNLVAGDGNESSDIFRKDLTTGAVVRVSTASDATQGNGGSYTAQISADGRYVVFSSDADNLVAGDTNGARDVFRKDLATGETIRLSSAARDAQGQEQANGQYFLVRFGADSDSVIFSSAATNLIAGDANGGNGDIYHRNLATGEITLVSSAGDVAHTQSNGTSSDPEVSGNGRYVVFGSSATNLVAGDDNDRTDIFRKDLTTGEVALVSSTHGGIQSNAGSYTPDVSADGRHVVFESNATTLTAGDVNNRQDVFVKDLTTGTIALASTTSDGTQSNGDSYIAKISADGRYAVFVSSATNLVAGDTNASGDIFRKDLTTGQLALVSAAGDARQTLGNAGASQADISADGRFVLITSRSNNLIAGDSNNREDVFRKDLTTGEVILVSTSTAFSQGNGESANATFSADGRYVVFESNATNLVAGDTNGNRDIFRKDLLTGELVRVSTASDAAQANQGSHDARISADGRHVIFQSLANNLVAGDTNGSADLFRKDLATGELVRLSTANRSAQGPEQGNFPSDDAHMSADGRTIVYESQATNLVAGDTNGSVDIFAVDASLLPHYRAIAEGRFIDVSLGVGSAQSATVAWGDGATSTAIPAGGRASLSHAYAASGLKAATVTLSEGAQSWIVPYLVDLSTGQMTRNAALYDTIAGSAGNDVITGDVGSNILMDRAGNDTYFIDETQDVALELSGGGLDRVLTSVSYALAVGSEVEMLTASGSGSIHITGNAFANTLTGGAGANRLNAGIGNDTVNGLAGIDILKGEAGNDKLYGGLGRDLLYGSSGRDIFVFDTKANKATNLDKIMDFNVRDDTIWLDNKYFSKIGKGTAAKPLKLNSKFFSLDKAQDGNDFVIYNKKSGVLLYDADGSGAKAAVQIAVLKKGLKMTYADFHVI